MDLLSLYSKEQIQVEIKRLATEIQNDYNNMEEVVFIGLLNGCFIFLADLIRNIDLPVKVDFMSVSSYGNETTSSGKINIIKDIKFDIKDKHIILVDDIIDTGLTLSYIKNYISKYNPASIKTCCLLNKEENRTSDIKLDYCGFICEDKFVIGYGMDCAEKYRNLPYIGYIPQ